MQKLPKEAGYALAANGSVMILVSLLCIVGIPQLAFWALLIPSMVLPVGAAAIAVEYGDSIPKLPVITAILGLQTSVSFALILHFV